MAKIMPLFNFFATPFLVLFFIILLIVQNVRPLRSQVLDPMKHAFLNAAVTLPALLIFRLAILPVGLLAADWSQIHNFGLLWRLPFPSWLEYTIGFLILDCTFYYWHILNHRITFLWRFHNVHHIDLDLDVSTAIRFHFGEMIFSIGFRAVQIAIFGISATLFLVYEIIFQAATEFHHSNWKLSIELERKLVKLIVTPRMHGIHHSIVENETNSNFSVIFSFWDRIHRTVRLNVPQNEITIGVPAYLNSSYQRISTLLFLPFKKQRDYWVKEDGTKPERRETFDPNKAALAP